jgi:hypothetical protein
VLFSLRSQILLNINRLPLKNILGVDIHHTFSNSPDLSLSVNNKYFRVLTAKKETGTALALKKGKIWKH